MPTLYANQSVTLAEVLDALANLLRKATAFDDRRVLEWHYDDRPSSNDIGRPVVWFRFKDAEFDLESGAGRDGTKCTLNFEINLTTRAFKDGNQRDKQIGRTHHATMLYIHNAVFDRVLHSAYEDREDEEPPKPANQGVTPELTRNSRRQTRLAQTPSVISVGTMKVTGNPAPLKPRSEQGYIETKMDLAVPVVVRVTVNDTPPLQAED